MSFGTCLKSYIISYIHFENKCPYIIIYFLIWFEMKWKKHANKKQQNLHSDSWRLHQDGFCVCCSLKCYHYVTVLKSDKNPIAITMSAIWNNVDVIETKITIPEKNSVCHIFRNEIRIVSIKTNCRWGVRVKHNLCGQCFPQWWCIKLH